MRKNRGEIATILTIGTLIVLGVTTIIGSVFMSQNKLSTKSRASEGANICANFGTGATESLGKSWVLAEGCNKKCKLTDADSARGFGSAACAGNEANAGKYWCYYFDDTASNADAPGVCLKIKENVAAPTAIPTSVQTKACDQVPSDIKSNPGTGAWTCHETTTCNAEGDCAKATYTGTNAGKYWCYGTSAGGRCLTLNAGTAPTKIPATPTPIPQPPTATPVPQQASNPDPGSSGGSSPGGSSSGGSSSGGSYTPPGGNSNGGASCTRSNQTTSIECGCKGGYVGQLVKVNKYNSSCTTGEQYECGDVVNTCGFNGCTNGANGGVCNTKPGDSTAVSSCGDYNKSGCVVSSASCTWCDKNNKCMKNADYAKGCTAGAQMGPPGSNTGVACSGIGGSQCPSGQYCNGIGVCASNIGKDCNRTSLLAQCGRDENGTQLYCSVSKNDGSGTCQIQPSIGNGNEGDGCGTNLTACKNNLYCNESTGKCTSNNGKRCDGVAASNLPGWCGPDYFCTGTSHVCRPNPPNGCNPGSIGACGGGLFGIGGKRCDVETHTCVDDEANKPENTKYKLTISNFGSVAMEITKVFSANGTIWNGYILLDKGVTATINTDAKMCPSGKSATVVANYKGDSTSYWNTVNCENGSLGYAD